MGSPTMMDIGVFSLGQGMKGNGKGKNGKVCCFVVVRAVQQGRTTRGRSVPVMPCMLEVREGEAIAQTSVGPRVAGVPLGKGEQDKRKYFDCGKTGAHGGHDDLHGSYML